jgi:hypothetical protein
MKKEFLKIGIIFFVTIAVVLWGLNFIFFNGNAPKSKATGETMTLSFDPTTVNTAAMGPTQLVSVTLRIKPTGTAIVRLRGYSLNIPFDKNKLDIHSIEYKIGSVSNGLGDTTANIAAINQSGVIRLVGEVGTATGATIPVANPTDLVTIKFVVPNNNATAITIEDKNISLFTVKSSDETLFNMPLASVSTLSINGGGPTATPTVTPGGPTATPTPTGGAEDNANLNLKLKLQGVGSKPPTEELSKMKIKFRLYDENTEKYADNDNSMFTADANGVWSGVVDFAVNPNHKYALLVKGSHHIQKRVCVKKPTETDGGTYKCAKGSLDLTAGDNDLDLSGIILLAGDLPVQDGTVDAYDISLVRNNIGKTDETSLAQSDINRDGKCDTQDYSLVIAALSVKSDEL